MNIDSSLILRLVKAEPAPVSTDPLAGAAFALALAHYADRFQKPADDPHVLMNARSQRAMFNQTAALAIKAGAAVAKGTML